MTKDFRRHPAGGEEASEETKRSILDEALEERDRLGKGHAFLQNGKGTNAESPGVPLPDVIGKSRGLRDELRKDLHSSAEQLKRWRQRSGRMKTL